MFSSIACLGTNIHNQRKKIPPPAYTGPNPYYSMNLGKSVVPLYTDNNSIALYYNYYSGGQNNTLRSFCSANPSVIALTYDYTRKGYVLYQKVQNGVGNSVNFSSPLFTPSVSYTAMLWFKMELSGTSTTLLAGPNITCKNGSITFLATSPYLTYSIDNNWNHVAYGVWYNSATASSLPFFYLNGVEKYNPTSGYVNVNGNILPGYGSRAYSVECLMGEPGTNGVNANSFKGYIDNFQMYDGKLSAANISTIYNYQKSYPHTYFLQS